MGSNLEGYPLLRAYLSAQFAAPPELTIHPHDEMLQITGRLDERDHDHARVYYLRAGLASLRAIEQVVNWRFGGWSNAGRILDFASGYGRLTRLLLQKLPAEAIAVAEINREAVAFQRELFGVEALVSTTDPEEFRYDGAFDVVFAGSLFSHLPERTFRGWLRRLWKLTSSRGCLLFSLHNERTLHRPVPPSAPFTFIAETFSRFVSPADYGNSFVSRQYFEEILREELGGVSFLRIPHGLANFQDLCVVVGDGDLSSLRFDIGPDGSLDGVHAEDDGRLWAFGWAGNRSPDHEVERIELDLGGVIVGTTKASLPRPDVADLHGGSFLHSGWRCELPLPRGLQSLHEVLQVRALSTSGHDALLWIGTVASAVIRAEWATRRDLGAERVADLEALVDSMQRSRFWRARSLWFALKRKLGLTRER